jgi:hypothetical protein
MSTILDRIALKRQRLKPIMAALRADQPVIIPTDVVRQLHDVVAYPPWVFSGYCAPDDFRYMVETAIAGLSDPDPRHAPFIKNCLPISAESDPIIHANRIAHLVAAHCFGPVTLDTSVFGHHPFIDGNHRLYAAIITGQNTVALVHNGVRLVALDMIQVAYAAYDAHAASATYDAPAASATYDAPAADNGPSHLTDEPRPLRDALESSPVHPISKRSAKSRM